MQQLVGHEAEKTNAIGDVDLAASTLCENCVSPARTSRWRLRKILHELCELRSAQYGSCKWLQIAYWTKYTAPAAGI